jgi:hypothetical protein
VSSYLVGREKIREYASAIGEQAPICHDVKAARAASGSRQRASPSPTAWAYSRTFSRPTA